MARARDGINRVSSASRATFGPGTGRPSLFWKIKTRLKRFKMDPKAHKEKQTQHQTQGKSVLFAFFENITFRTYFVNSYAQPHLQGLWVGRSKMAASSTDQRRTREVTAILDRPTQRPWGRGCLVHCLKCRSILTAIIQPGLPVVSHT